jgi:phage anti-repressor protein
MYICYTHMQSLDIVELQNNPITKLSNIYQSKFLTKLKENFTDDEQQMYVTSFFCFLNCKKTDYVIDLDDFMKWLGFSKKDKAKSLLERHFTQDLDYKLLPRQREHNVVNKNGGNNKDTYMLTVKTFKMLCLKAGTAKANQIHEYYIRLEETLHEVINEESDELKLQLEDQKEKHVKDLKKNKEIERQNILLSEFGSKGPLIYIIKVKSYENGEYVIKIGESRCGVLNRYNEHRTNYGDILLLDCFSVNKSKDFESFLHNHEKMKKNKVTDLVGHENERELFLIGKNITYKTLNNIIINNIKNFDDNNALEVEKLKLEIHNLKIQIEMNENVSIPQNDNSRLLVIIEKLQNSNENLEQINKELTHKLNNLQPRTTTNFNTQLATLGPRLQKINPETLQLVKVYESVTECMNENSSIKRPSINKAVLENTIYCGFRWIFVDRELDANVVGHIKPTIEVREQNIGYIAKLNSDKTEIVNVYLDRKNASQSNGHQSASSLDVPVKNFTISNGHYYILYENCSDELKDNFIQKNNGEPILYKNGVGQYDDKMNLLEEFLCKYDVIRKLRMSDRTLAKALDKDLMYNNRYYKSIGSKLKCF